MQFSDGSSLYKILNQILCNEDHEELKPWFSFLKLFFTALYKKTEDEVILMLGSYFEVIEKFFLIE